MKCDGRACRKSLRRMQAIARKQVRYASGMDIGTNKRRTGAQTALHCRSEEDFDLHPVSIKLK